MLLLLTILLVLVAAITLVIGIFSDQLALIWVSIASSFAAAVVLAVVSQMSKRRAQADAAAPVPAAPEPAPPVTAQEQTVADVPPGEPTAVVPAVAEAHGFPIDNYDELKVNEIIPQLDGLSLDELEMVAVYEEDNKNRTTVLSRIDDLMDELEGAEAAPAAAETAPDAAPAPAPAAPASAADLPIAGYDDLNVSDIIPKLEDLDADELEAVAVYEESNKDRVTVLNAIDDRLDILEGVVPAPAPAKKAPAKKAAKTSTKKSAAKKAPAKKAAAKKSTTKKAAAKKSTTKKAAAKKSTAKKTTAKKAAKKSTKKR